LKIALARCPGLSFLTAGLPSFATRKARQTSSYKVYPPINFTYIDEMMAFLCKSKFPMINIAIIITIANQNCFLLWFLFLEQFIISAKGYHYWSIVLYPVWFPIVRSPTAPGLTFEGDSDKEISLWGLASLSRGSRAKSNSPCNFEEPSYVAAYFYWYLSHPLSILKVIFLKSNPFRFEETLILFNNK
jgi:hypothetical protein